MSDVKNTKEVYFHQYCSSCIHKDVDEKDDPCDECLTYPSNENSHKPINYKEDKDEHKTKVRRSSNASS